MENIFKNRYLSSEGSSAGGSSCVFRGTDSGGGKDSNLGNIEDLSNYKMEKLMKLKFVNECHVSENGGIGVQPAASLFNGDNGDVRDGDRSSNEGGGGGGGATILNATNSGGG